MTNHPNRSRVKDWPAHIRRFRERHSLTQTQLAEHLTAGQENEVYVSTVQRWEYGDRKPPPYLKLALAQIAAKLSRESEGQDASARSESKGAR